MSMRMTRLLPVALAFAFLTIQPQPIAAEAMRHHALSLIGEPKYPAGFKHFSYVNPKAPKGGKVRRPAIGSFDNLNPFVLKGVAASGSGLIYDSLMASSLEEPSTGYGLLAEWVTYPEDFSTATFKLREGARWHDGKPVTIEDVIFSLQTLKTKGHPFYGKYYKNVVKAEETGEREVTFTFDVTGNRELPMIIGELTILPKHYWTGKDENGKPRDFAKTTLKAPLGSGPYRIKDVKAGRSLTLERVKDYWAKDLPVKIGQNNFDEIQFEYYRDTTVAFQAFKADRLDFYTETSSKNWATGYDFKAVKNKWIKRELIKLKRGQAMQAFVFNTRREKFKDPRVRRAFGYAFDFEWANKNLFYGQYKRITSYFQNTELASSALPLGLELEILNGVKDLVPKEVFTTPYSPPATDGSGSIRKNLREAIKLFKTAGWKVKDRKLVNSKGEQMTADFLLVSPLFERIIQPYMRNLERLGIKTSLRVVDAPQYRRRLDGFDYDIIVASFGQSQSPGNEQRNFWGSASADENGSRNLIGIKNPAIDKLIDKIIFAENRTELVAATHALDRVLLWNHYVVPQWYVPYARVAHWDRLGRPETFPAQSVGFPNVWWWDDKAAKKLAAKK